LLVSSRFHVLTFTTSGVLFTFPRPRTVALIGHTEVLALRGGPRGFHTEFHVLRATRDQLGQFRFRVRGFHTLSRRAYSTLLLNVPGPHWLSTTPMVGNHRFYGSSRSLAATQGVVFNFPFPQPTKISFTFVGGSSQPNGFSAVLGVCPCRKFPIKGVFPSPETLIAGNTVLIATSVCQGMPP